MTRVGFKPCVALRPPEPSKVIVNGYVPAGVTSPTSEGVLLPDPQPDKLLIAVRPIRAATREQRCKRRRQKNRQAPEGRIQARNAKLLCCGALLEASVLETFVHTWIENVVGIEPAGIVFALRPSILNLQMEFAGNPEHTGVTVPVAPYSPASVMLRLAIPPWAVVSDGRAAPAAKSPDPPWSTSEVDPAKLALPL